jgi:ribosomal protein S18 acetylase RimI-like enzyme
MRPPGATLRPITGDDDAFLFALYASTREVELAPVPWPEEQKIAFLRYQFDLQHQHYTTNYPGATLDLIEVDGEPAGRLYVCPRAAEIRIMDIAFLPAFRGRGLGTALLAELQERGRASGRTVTIHVERDNPALRLYQRLGFEIAGDVGVYWLLEWQPGEAHGF